MQGGNPLLILYLSTMTKKKTTAEVAEIAKKSFKFYQGSPIIGEKEVTINGINYVEVTTSQATYLVPNDKD